MQANYFSRAGVSVHVSCYKKISQAGWLTNNRNLFLMVPESGGLRSGRLHGLEKGPLSGHRPLIVSSQGGRDEGALWGLSYKDTNPIVRAPPS